MAHTAIRPSDVLRTILEHPRRIVTPLALVTLLAAGYALWRPATWEASQALVVRNEAGDATARPGKFGHADEMKTVQETILELARNRSVLAKALVAAGPPSNHAAGNIWPNQNDVEDLQSNVKITPPKGAEFGKTEVFYLKVRDKNQARAIQLADAVCRQVQVRFDSLRESKAQSTINELLKSASLAQADLNVATEQLGQMEQAVGKDLSELRILNESPSGDSDLRRTQLEVEREIRAFRAALDENQAHLKMLSAAQEKADVLAIPSALVKAQPALGRLKDGLVDAQLRTGALLGPFSAAHPAVNNARAAEEAIRQQLFEEINAAKNGIEVDLHVNAERVRVLEAQNAEIQVRLERLATVRAEYSNLVANSKSRSEKLKSVETELSEACASRAAANSGSLITLLDTPDVGNAPVGPTRAVILLGGIFGGLLTGLALVFLSVAPTPAPASQVRRATSPNMTVKQALSLVGESRWFSR